MQKPGPVKGRGAGLNPANRFEQNRYEWEPTDDEPDVAPRTEFLRDSSQSIVTENKSPDIPFRYSINPYRGCEHGCAYCYARPSHEYLGFSAGLDFETKIFFKEKAAELLRAKLMSPRWKPELIAISGITDCYQPIERKMKITRSCLEVLLEFRNPVSLITKNRLITRDIDLLSQFAEWNGTAVFLSITTLKPELSAQLEPRTSSPLARLEAIRKLAEAGVPVGVNFAPCIPGLNDVEMPAILEAAAEAGAKHAGFTPLRLPSTVLPIFEQWLTDHYPDRKAKVLALQKDVRGGRLNDARFGTRMKGEGPVAENLRQMFQLTARRLGLNREKLRFSTDHFCRPGDQLAWF